MGAISERMYGGVFPGLNNTVRHIRPYTALCWIINSLHKNAFAQGKADIAELRQKTQQCLWKMQLLLNWLAKLDGLHGYPGSERFEGAPKSVELRKESWSKTSISFWDTAWYKPSLLNGLRFLNEGEKAYRGTYSCTPAGVALAEAFDAAVQALPPALAKWLADPKALTCTKARLEALRPVLALDKPTAKERSAFLRQFFYAEFDSDKKGGGKERSKGLILALRTVAALQEETSDQSMEMIRHAMAAGVTPLGKSIDLTGVEATRVQWAVLQVRALQRLAMETLLGLVERHILQAEQVGTPRRAADMAEAISTYLKPSRSLMLRTVGENYQKVRKEQGKFSIAQAAGLVNCNQTINLPLLKAGLRGNVSPNANEWPAVARLAIWALIVCAVEADNLAPMVGAKRLLNWDKGKLSLKELSTSVQKYRADSVEVFTRHVIESFVIAQHLKVAVERSIGSLDGKYRFVFSPERDGLTRMANTVAVRFVNAQESGDILFNAMLLLENCGKLAFTAPKEEPAYTHRRKGCFKMKRSCYRLLEGGL